MNKVDGVAQRIHAVVEAEDFKNRTYILAVCKQRSNEGDRPERWDELDETEKDFYRKQARAVLAYLSGF